MLSYLTYLAYSWGYGEEYHVEISCLPNWIARGDLESDRYLYKVKYHLRLRLHYVI